MAGCRIAATCSAGSKSCARLPKRRDAARSRSPSIRKPRCRTSTRCSARASTGASGTCRLTAATRRLKDSTSWKSSPAPIASREQCLRCATQRGEGSLVAVEPPVVVAAGLHLQHEPFTLGTRELGDIQAWDEQAVLTETHRDTIPTEHTHIGSGASSKAGPPHVNAILEIRALPSRGLHLQTHKSMRVDMARQELDGLEVR